MRRPRGFPYGRYHAVRCLGIFVIGGIVLYLYLGFAPPPGGPHGHHALWHPAPPHPSLTTSEEWNRRASAVKEAFAHAYRGYTRHAAPNDELRPLSNTSTNNFNGWGVTMFDSLDTMILMGLEDEFTEAIKVIEHADFKLVRPEVGPGRYESDVYAPFFETVIRYLGGLLSAYALTNEPVLLQKADELAAKLSPAFNTPTGFPTYGVNTVNGKITPTAIGMLAEIGSCQLEFSYLAKVTGRREYQDKSERVVKSLLRTNITGLGMLPMRLDLKTGKPFGISFSVGASADSAHEYLLKYYLLTAQTDTASLDLYMQTVNHIITNLMYLTPTRDLLYVTDLHGPSGLASHTLEHLSCFLPGLIALGVHSLPRSAFNRPITSQIPSHKLLSSYDTFDLHQWAATGLAETCWLMYADQPSGLGPETVIMHHPDSERVHPKAFGQDDGTWIRALEKWRKNKRRGTPPGVGPKTPMIIPDFSGIQNEENSRRGYHMRRVDYLLRPETIESMYLMWKTTGDARWRERAWDIFQALEREAKTQSGYAIVKLVAQSSSPLDDDMPSFFLAETLKYLYLMFLEDDPLPLDKWVFNTEAHPFPIFSWSPS